MKSIVGISAYLRNLLIRFEAGFFLIKQFHDEYHKNIKLNSKEKQ